MKPILFALALCAFVAACSHGGDVPYDVPFCGADVTPCPGFPTKDSLDTVHVVQAECADANMALACEIDTHATYAYAACSRCDETPWLSNVAILDDAALAQAGVRICSPLAYRTGAYCAECSDIGASMQYGYVPASSGGFASSIVCVASCAACTVAPQSRRRPGGTLENSR